MSDSTTRVLICSLVTLLILATSAAAQTLIGPEHVNDNYPGPAGEGFQLAGDEPLGAPVGVSADFPNGAWRFQTVNLGRYKSNTPPILGDFTLTLRGIVTNNVHFNNPGGTNPQPEDLRATGINFVVDAVSNANPRYSFGWNEQLTRVIHQHDAASGIPAQFFALDATQVHTYQLVRENGVADFYVDCVEVISNVDNQGITYGQGLDNHTGLFFGSLSSQGPSEGDSTWDLIRLEEGVNICPSPEPETEFTWTASGVGEWDVASNWQPSNGRPPDNSNETAIFGDSIGSAARTVVTDSSITVNSIKFQNTQGGSYVVAGAGSLNLAETTSDPITSPTLEVSNQGSHQFQAIVNLQNDTTATIDSGSTLTFTNSLNLNGQALTKMGAGTLAVNNILSTGGGTLNCNEGTCSGSGTIGGNVNNDSGTISPGNSPGVMIINGDFAQGTDGALMIELAGTTAGTEYDVLQVDGGASLSGTLEISLLDGFEPGAGDTFNILELGSVAGQFDVVTLPELAGSLAWDDSMLLTDGSLSVVPEPATASLLLSLGLVATIGSSWCRPKPARRA